MEKIIMMDFGKLKSCVGLLCLCATVSAFGAGAKHPAKHAPQKCILPAPDGNDLEPPSHANTYGITLKKTNSTITIREKNTNGKILIKFNGKTEFYTAFGGGGRLSDLPPEMQPDFLQPGLQAWVWYENCKKPMKGTPLAAMIVVFSTSPSDKDPDWDKEGDFPWPDRTPADQAEPAKPNS